MLRNVGFILVSFLLLNACQNEEQSNSEALETRGESEEKMVLTITSSAFDHGSLIPKKYTCDGEGISPPLFWNSTSANIESFALICDDPDAPMGTWVHWVMFNIPGDSTRLAEGISPEEILENGTKQGTNDFGKIGYGGPCPPNGTHRYYFKLYALDTTLDIESGVTKAQLLQAMQGHILAEGQLMGKYTREN